MADNDLLRCNKRASQYKAST